MTRAMTSECLLASCLERDGWCVLFKVYCFDQVRQQGAYRLRVMSSIAAAASATATHSLHGVTTLGQHFPGGFLVAGHVRRGVLQGDHQTARGSRCGPQHCSEGFRIPKCMRFDSVQWVQRVSSALLVARVLEWDGK